MKMFNSDKQTLEYQITDIDLWENDANLKVGDLNIYFQFNGNKIPTIEDALKWLSQEATKATQYALLLPLSKR